MLGKYLKYRLKAHYWHGHHVHSPYTYWIMTNVVYERWPYYSFDKIEKLRRKTKFDERGNLEPKYCQLLQRLCATNNARNIVQYGFGDGWESMYLAANDTRAMVSVHGVIADAARKRLQLLGFHNVVQNKTLSGDIDILLCLDGEIRETFNGCVGRMREGGIMIFGNIHSYDDEWDEVRKDTRVSVSMDLYKIGVCWLRSDMQKEHYIVKF